MQIFYGIMILHFFRRTLGCLTIFFPCRFQARSPASPGCMECSHAFYFPPSPYVPGLGRSIAIAVGRNRSYWECTIGALYACSSRFRLCGGCHLRVWRVRKFAEFKYGHNGHTKVPRSLLSINYLSHKAKAQLFKRLFLLLACSEYLFILETGMGGMEFQTMTK